MSRFFDHMNELGDPCPICKTKEQGQIILVAILGTEKGGNVQAQQVHRRCAELVSYDLMSAIKDEADSKHDQIINGEACEFCLMPFDEPRYFPSACEDCKGNEKTRDNGAKSTKRNKRRQHAPDDH